MLKGQTCQTRSDLRALELVPRFNPQVRAVADHVQALERSGSDGSIRELGLAVAVVKQAFHDLGHGSPAIRAEARDYLLRRLWDDANVIGQVLRHAGVRRLSPGKLVHAHIRVIDGDAQMPMAAKRARWKRGRA